MKKTFFILFLFTFVSLMAPPRSDAAICTYCPPRDGYLFTALKDGKCFYNKCEGNVCPAAKREEVTPQSKDCKDPTPVCDFIRGCLGGTGTGTDCETNGYSCLGTCGDKVSQVNSCRDRNLVCCGAQLPLPPGGTGTWGAPGAGPSLDSVSKLLGSGAPANASKASFNSIIGLVLSLLIIAAIILSLLFLIWGGFDWITSEGDKQKLQSARHKVVFAIVGLVIVFLAFFVVNVVSNLFGIK